MREKRKTPGRVEGGCGRWALQPSGKLEAVVLLLCHPLKSPWALKKKNTETRGATPSSAEFQLNVRCS